MHSALKLIFPIFILTLTMSLINKFNISRLMRENNGSIGRLNSSINSQSFLAENSFEGLKANFNISSFHEVMQHRIEHINIACKKISEHGEALPSTASLGFWANQKIGASEPVQIYILRKEQIAWCPVPKAASTSWKINMLHLRASNEQIEDLVERITIPEDRLTTVGFEFLSMQQWKSYSSVNNANLTLFMIVRHPFHRIVSAFRSIFEETNIFSSKVGSKIVEEFRDSATASGRFSEEESFLASKKQLTQLTKQLIPKTKYLKTHPTFWEFVQAVINNAKYLSNLPFDDMSVHWRPIYQQCSVCHASMLSNVKYILKYENLDAEEDQLLRYLGWNDIIHHKAHVIHQVNNKTKLEKDIPELTKLYFSTLDKDDVYELYVKYKPDFELFGYPFRWRDWS